MTGKSKRPNGHGNGSTSIELQSIMDVSLTNGIEPGTIVIDAHAEEGAALYMRLLNEYAAVPNGFSLFAADRIMYICGRFMCFRPK